MKISQKNNVLKTLAELLTRQGDEIIHANGVDMDAFPDMDASMRDRLKVDGTKIEGMIHSLEEVVPRPTRKVKFYPTHP